MIKAGQVYRSRSLVYAICFVGKGYCRREQVQCIKPSGLTFSWSFAKAQRYCGELLAEYPTWQEAVNSVYFSGEKK